MQNQRSTEASVMNKKEGAQENRISYHKSDEEGAILNTLAAVPITGRCTSTSTSSCC